MVWFTFLLSLQPWIDMVHSWAMLFQRLTEEGDGQGWSDCLVRFVRGIKKTFFLVFSFLPPLSQVPLQWER